MRKGNKRGIKYVYPVEWISSNKIMGSVLIKEELIIGTLYAQVKIARIGSVLLFEDPTGMAQVRKWGNRSFELDSVTYINDVKTTGRQVFSLAKFSILETKNKNYLSEQIENSGKKGKRSFAVEVLRDQIITQGVFVNKSNQPYVFVTSEETTFDMSANFEGLTFKDVIQRELDRFFIWEFLTNENILRVLEKHECIIYCIIWHLAKESGSWEVFITEKNRLEVTRNQSVE